MAALSVSNNRRMLLACLVVFCLILNTKALSIDDRAGDVHTSPAKLKEQRHPIVFQHKHFFNYDLEKPHLGPTNFQVRDTRDIFDHGVTSSWQLASFTLRTKFNDHNQPDEVESSVQHVIRPEKTLRSEPNTTDKETVVNLAKMTSDAYIYDPREPSWLNTSLGFNFTGRFGWRGEGLRGHVFTTEDYMNVVISFKGTTIDPRDKLSGKDQLNDRKLFSCCCGAQQPWGYSPVCNCTTGFNQCNSDCLTRSLLQNDSYYDAALYIIEEIQAWYPDASFWITGHSLGGALASLVGLTLNIPAVTFEAPPERLPAERMGLLPNSTSDRAMAHHFGNTGDPIYMGECNGFWSTCSFWGFSFDSKCSTGSRCTYDTRKDKGWSSSVTNHRINYVIENVLEAYDEVPKCEPNHNCTDCAEWQFT